MRLTSTGTNRAGRFSPDGKKILFVSSNREQHKNSQIYELNLENFREKRITYQDGDCLEAEYTPDGNKMIYASTTDELKERPKLLHPAKEERPPTELYLSDLRGVEIERLTHLAGYQGEVSWVSPHQILFSSEKNGSLEIHTLTLPGKQSSIWQSDKQGTLDLPTVNSNGRLSAWLSSAPTQAIQIHTKKNSKNYSFELPFTEVQSLQWIEMPDKKTWLMMSAKKKGDPYLAAWLLDTDQKCTQAFFQEKGDVADLRVSNQGKILFTLQIEGKSQLFLRDFPSLTASCEALPKDLVLGTSAAIKPVADPSEHPKTP